MKKAILILILPFICSIAFGQNKAGAEKLVNEGIPYHDKGDFDGAIKRYDKALKLDKDNLFALSEKALSLISQEKYDEAVVCCEKAIAAHPGDPGLKTIYIAYGNASDGLKQTDKSIEIYDQGIKEFPDFYQLYFNKGVSLASVQKYDEAILCFQKSVALNPMHASSHNAIARLSAINNKQIPAILAYCKFLSIEPQSNRAKENLQSLQKLMSANVEKTGRKSVTISFSPDMLGDTTADGKPKENSFTSTELILSLSSALDFDKKNKKKSEVELFTEKFKTVCASLKETKKDNYGFYWEFYAPFFVEMHDKDYIETFAYIAFATSGDPNVIKWIKAHQTEVKEFLAWSKDFEFSTN